MKNTVLKYAMMLGLGMALASCADDELGNVAVDSKQPVSHLKSFNVSMDGDKSIQKAMIEFGSDDYNYYYNYNRMYTSFTKGDSLSVFANGSNNIFNHNFDYENSCSYGYFTGDAEDALTYYALFPAQPAATISGNTIKAVVPSYINNIAFSMRYYQYSYCNASGAVCVGYSNDNNFSLHHTTGYMGLMNVCNDYSDPIRYIKKIVIEAPVNIAGDVTISGIDEEKPVATGGSSKTITLDNLAYNYNTLAISMLPVKDVDIKVTFYRIDGAVFSYKFPKFSVEAGQCVLIDHFDETETFKVTFKDGDNKSESVVKKGTPLSDVAPEWSREGYTLKWLDEQGNVYDDIFVVDDSYYSFSKGILSDRTFTASWEKKDCYVTYTTNDGEEKVKVEPGSYFTLPELPEGSIYWENPKYLYHGGYDDGTYGIYGRQASDFRLQPGDMILITEATTLYPNQYNRLVTVDANGGKFEDETSVKEWRYPDGLWVSFNTNYNSENMAFQSIYFSYSEREPDQLHKKPVRDGYRLVGFKCYKYGKWDEAISFDYTNDGGSSDYIFIAQWEKSYKIEYLDENGNVAKTSDYINGELFNLDYTLPSNGKFQTGWKDQDGNILRVGENYVSILDEVKDLVLTPVFSDKTGSSNAGYDEEKYDRF